MATPLVAKIHRIKGGSTLPCDANDFKISRKLNLLLNV